MSNTPYVGRNVHSFNTAPEFEGFSKVVIVVTDELEYAAGTDTGRTLSLVCPWGTQDMANNILEDIKGYKYHPYNAAGAYLDPSSEIGDGVTVNGIYSGIYTMDVNFGGDCRVDISAPSEEEIDHEYPYVPKQERTVNRKFSQIESEFKVQADQISAKVSKTGGSNQSFGWSLDEKSWTLKSKNKTVLIATENGLSIEGEIRATSGKLGGFDILSDHLSYNGLTWKDTKITIGAYLGTNGLQLGKNFRVDMQGNLYAASGTFEGTIYAGNIVYGSKNGVNYGTLNGAAIAGTSIKLGKLESGVQTSLRYANYANDVFSGNVRASFVKASTLSGSVIKMGGVSDDGYTLGTTQISYTKGDGTVATLNVVTWS